MDYNRRHFIKSCAKSVIALPLAGMFHCDSSRKKPNIIVILSDDAGFDDFGFQGETDIRTPHLDKLASEGIVFGDAHVTATVCSPSRAGLMTGRYQQRFGHEGNSPPHGQGMDPEERTLADALKEQGYKTAIFGKWHLGETQAYHPNNRGFDEFYGMLGGARSYFPSEQDDQPGNARAVMHKDLMENREPEKLHP